MVEGIPGSSPDWRSANMKTKGRATPSEVPPSHLNGGTSGLAKWSGSSPDAMQHNSRRHFHQFQVAQTTAWDCLPCVDTAHQSSVYSKSWNPPGSISSNNSSNSDGGTADLASSSLGLSNKAPRRHRRQVPPPPCQERPQGKRMLHAAAPQSTCKELLQDPQPFQHNSTAPPVTTATTKCSTPGASTIVIAEVAAAAAAAAASMPGIRTAANPQHCVKAPHIATVHVEVPAAKQAVTSSSEVLRRLTPAAARQSSAASQVPDLHDCSQPGANSSDCAGSLDCVQSSRQASSRSSHGNTAGGMLLANSFAGSGSSQGLGTGSLRAGAPCTGRAAAKAPGKKAGRVEDDPNFFRTPKDPPTLQRFAASLAQLSVSQGGTLSTAQRHEAGIRAKQQAQLVAAAHEVAALDAGSQQDID